MIDPMATKRTHHKKPSPVPAPKPMPLPVQLPTALSAEDRLQLQVFIEREARIKAQLDALGLEMVQRQHDLSDARASLEAHRAHVDRTYQLGPTDRVLASNGAIQRGA